jgi:hypothetical protein
MTNHTHHPTLSVTVEQVTALVDAASGTGTDTAAIEALEAVVSKLRAAQGARLALATRVPTELLRQILLARCADHRAGESR